MKYLIGVIAVLLIFLGGYIVGQKMVDPCPAAKEDTLRVVDTVFLQQKVVKKPYKPVPNKIIPADDVNDIHVVDIPKYVYQDSLIDSNLAIYINDTTAGEILGRGISYTLKVPLQIKETITITKTAEIPVLQHGFFIGAEIGFSVSRNFRLAPEIEYLTKKGYAYSYNYDVINNLHSVGVKRKVF